MNNPLFDIEGTVVVPKKVCFIMDPLSRFIDKYGDKAVAYLHFMKTMDKSEAYGSMPIPLRSDTLISDLGIMIDIEDDVVRRALLCAEEQYYTTEYGLFRGMKSMMDKIGQKLLEVDIDLDKDGNSIAVSRLLERYESYIKNFKGSYRDFEETLGDMKVRGGGQLASDEDKDY